MTMRFASLGSGSRGNATLVESGQTCILIDCGFSMREALQRLAQYGWAAESLSAIVVTHEHTDHIKGVGALARKYSLPVWASQGTRQSSQLGELPIWQRIDINEAFEIGDLEVQPFPVPHDAREPCQFVVQDGQHSLGILTDVGCITQHIRRQLHQCDALLLECNHDTEILQEGEYPASLKQRVGGDFGHLSNAQAADLLAGLEHSRLQHLVAAHLSEQNNTPYLARSALSEVLGCNDHWIAVADQATGLAWRELA